MNYKIKSFLLGNNQDNSTSQDIGFLLLRFFVGLALCTVFEKLFPKNGIWGPQEWFIQDTANMGFPFPVFFAWVAVLSEFFGGILLMLGLFTRPAALVNVFVTFTATFIYHKGDIIGSGLLSFFFLIMCTCILLFGAGKFSLEYLICKQRVQKIVSMSMIVLLLIFSNSVVANAETHTDPTQKETTIARIDASGVEFYLKNNSLLSKKCTFIIYNPQQEGNSTHVKWFLPYQKIKFELPIGSRVYIATRPQIDIVMQGKRIDGDTPFVVVVDKLKNKTLYLKRHQSDAA